MLETTVTKQQRMVHFDMETTEMFEGKVDDEECTVIPRPMTTSANSEYNIFNCYYNNYLSFYIYKT